MPLFNKVALAMLPALFVFGTSLSAQSPTVERVADNLNNPRGVAVMPDGRLLVVEAGIGDDVPGEVRGSGQISILDDVNADGDYDDEGERIPILTRQPSYNGLALIRSGHDEVFGLGDIVVLDDGRIFYTKDDPYAEPGHAGTEGFHGDVGIFEIRPDQPEPTRLVQRLATLNALAFDPERELFYVVESGFNQMMSLTLDGEAEVVAPFVPLAHVQQAVPAGIAFDATTGDVLVALFSGHVHNYYSTDLAFMPGDAKIVRFDPATGAVTDEIAGLTTAVDVAVDPEGNIFVVELTTAWPTAYMPYEFDLHSPDMPPDPGGYARFAGCVTMYPADGSEAVVLADGLDTPTNITYADDRLYVSTGLGTPGRSVLTADGVTQIEGAIYMITGF